MSQTQISHPPKQQVKNALHSLLRNTDTIYAKSREIAEKTETLNTRQVAAHIADLDDSEFTITKWGRSNAVTWKIKRQ